MKTNKNYLKLALGVLAFGSLAACTQESGYLSKPEGGENTYTVNLAKSPDIDAYSGGRSVDEIFKTYGANVNGNQWADNWDIPAAITEEERQKVLATVAEPRYEQNEIKIDWQNYWVQQVWKGTDHYNDGYNNDVLGSDKMNHLIAWDDNTFNYYPRNDWGEYTHINNFNSGNNSAWDGLMLMENMKADLIDAQHQFGYSNSQDSGNNYFDYIIVEVDGYYYVCFDFGAAGPNPNEQVERDHVYTDWIVKIMPAYPKGQTPTENPGGVATPTEPDPDPETPEQPEQPVVNNEVEVNLSVEEHDGYLASHLSIHVRAITDVKITIPVKEDYYADADDLAIVQQHQENYMLHGGPKSVEYEVVPGHIITLNFEYNKDNIVVWTDGIDAETISYLRKTYNDGLTFEIWTYVNDLNLKETLKADLNNATIEFLDAEPDLYVNAFMYDPFGSGDIFGDDCTVSIIPSQGINYQDGVQGWHYNGSEYNQLYYKK